MKIDRLITNICSDDLSESKQFYTGLFGLDISFDSDWFVLLRSGTLELGIVKRDHDLVPPSFRSNSSGYYLTFVVSDVEVIYQKLLRKGHSILEAPHDTFYGQCRMLFKDPDGALIDVSSPMKDFK